MNLNEQMQQVLSGAMYNDLTPELNKARQNALILTNEYNASYGPVSYTHLLKLKPVISTTVMILLLPMQFIMEYILKNN